MKRIAVVLALFASSCSWALTRPPDRSRPALCSTTTAAPIFDLWNAIGGGVLTLWMLSETEGSQADTMGVLALITGGTTAVYAASAHYGFKNARACRELQHEVALREPLPADEPLPPEVEQHVDVTEDQIDIHTTIRKPKAP
jgi:hypothetical protein